MSAVDRPYNPSIDVEGVLITDELGRRASREPDFEAESRALPALAHEMANSPATVLQKLAEFVLELCRSDSAGISLLGTESSAGRRSSASSPQTGAVRCRGRQVPAVW